MDIRSQIEVTDNTIIKTIANILILSTLLIGCSNDLEDFERALAIKQDGVFVNLSPEIQQAIALPDGKVNVQLRVVSTSDGTETEQTLTINKNKDVASNETRLPLGEYRYYVRIVYNSDNSTQEPLLLAAGSKTSSSTTLNSQLKSFKQA